MQLKHTCSRLQEMFECSHDQRAPSEGDGCGGDEDCCVPEARNCCGMSPPISPEKALSSSEENNVVSPLRGTPFLGIILSPYDKANESCVSTFR